MPCMEYERWCFYKIWRFLDPLTHTHLRVLGHSEHGSQGLTCSSACFRAQEQLLSWLPEVSFPKEMLLKSCAADLLGVCGASRYRSLSPIFDLTSSTWAEHQTTEQTSYVPNFHSEFGRAQWTLLLQGHAYVDEYIFPYLKYPRSQFSNVSMTSTYLHRSLRICDGKNANLTLHCLLTF